MRFLSWMVLEGGITFEFPTYDKNVAWGKQVQ